MNAGLKTRGNNVCCGFTEHTYPAETVVIKCFCKKAVQQGQLPLQKYVEITSCNILHNRKYVTCMFGAWRALLIRAVKS